ncbi:MAG: hypothetical protein WCS65_06055 [Verrucomicrobiae bacterium]
MTLDHLENWYLRKFDSSEIFGPVRFEQIRSWAQAAQVNSHDMVSTDKEVWTKAPMIPDLAMDWLIEVTDVLLYGPTTAEALIEFYRAGEISRETTVINCRTAEAMPLAQNPFFSAKEQASTQETPPHLGIRVNVQKRIRDLESSLIESRRQLDLAKDTIAKLEATVRELQTNLDNVRSGRR